MAPRPLRRRTTAIAATIAALTLTTAGTAAALPGWVPVLEVPYPGPVVGGQRALPNSVAERTTADGWVLHVEKTDESVNFAPALDGGVTTGESFGTLTGKMNRPGSGGGSESTGG